MNPLLGYKWSACPGPLGHLLQNTIDLVAYRWQKFISHSSGKSIIKVWFVQGCLLAVSLHGGRGRDLSGASFMRALISFTRTLSLWPHHLPKALPPNAITLSIRISAYEFWWGHIQSIACPEYQNVIESFGVIVDCTHQSPIKDNEASLSGCLMFCLEQHSPSGKMLFSPLPPCDGRNTAMFLPNSVAWIQWLVEMWAPDPS